MALNQGFTNVARRQTVASRQRAYAECAAHAPACYGGCGVSGPGGLRAAIAKDGLLEQQLIVLRLRSLPLSVSSKGGTQAALSTEPVLANDTGDVVARSLWACRPREARSPRALHPRVA